MLMEENIQEIMLLCFFAKEHDMIENIMEISIENHLGDKGHIEDCRKNTTGNKADHIADIAPEKEIQSRYSDKEQRPQEHIRIEIHAPPKTKTKTTENGLNISP